MVSKSSKCIYTLNVGNEDVVCPTLYIMEGYMMGGGGVRLGSAAELP